MLFTQGYVDDGDEKVAEWWNIFYTFCSIVLKHEQTAARSRSKTAQGINFTKGSIFASRFSAPSLNSKLKTHLKYSSYSRARGNCCCWYHRSPPPYLGYLNPTHNTNSKIHNIKKEFFKINFRQIVRNSRFKNIWLLKNESKFILDEIGERMEELVRRGEKM